MQPSSSTPATIVSAENQDVATIVKATFFFCHYQYYIVWESNKAGEARGQSWNESLKSRWIPGGSYGYTSGTKQKHFAELSSPRPCWRWLQLQPSCGSPQWVSPDLGGLPNLVDLPNLVLSFDLHNAKPVNDTSGLVDRQARLILRKAESWTSTDSKIWRACPWTGLSHYEPEALSKRPGASSTNRASNACVRMMRARACVCACV